MRNSLFAILILALVSFAQAGPFGLKNGMTVDEIIKAGFKVDKKKYESLTGRQWSFLQGVDNLEKLKSDKSRPNEEYELYSTIVVNSKYPNTLFYLGISKLVGLTNVGCYKFVGINKPISNESLKILFQDYCEKIENKYKTKPVTTNIKARYILYPFVNNIQEIIISHKEFEYSKSVPKKYIRVFYKFLAHDLHYKKKMAALDKKEKEEIKDLLPKEEDL